MTAPALCDLHPSPPPLKVLHYLSHHPCGKAVTGRAEKAFRLAKARFHARSRIDVEDRMSPIQRVSDLRRLGMANEPTAAPTANPTLQATQVYGMAIVCLVVGLAIGYLLRASQSPISLAQAGSSGSATKAGSAMSGGQRPSVNETMPGAIRRPQPAATVASANPHAGGIAGGRMPTMAEMKQMADKQAAPLLEKLKSDPNNSTLLTQVGAIY